MQGSVVWGGKSDFTSPSGRSNLRLVATQPGDEEKGG